MKHLSALAFSILLFCALPAQSEQISSEKTFVIQFEFGVPVRSENAGVRTERAPIPRNATYRFGPHTPDGKCLSDLNQTCVTSLTFSEHDCSDASLPACNEVTIDLIRTEPASSAAPSAPAPAKDPRLLVRTDYYESGENGLRLVMEWALPPKGPMIYYFVPTASGKFENVTMTVLATY